VGEVVALSYHCSLRGEGLEVRRQEGAQVVTSSLDCRGNVLVSAVETAKQESEERSVEDDDVEVNSEIQEEVETKEWEEEEEAEEVWVADGEVRREVLALPGGREALALYQVPGPPARGGLLGTFCCY
jgi:hypothetical protein